MRGRQRKLVAFGGLAALIAVACGGGIFADAPTAEEAGVDGGLVEGSSFDVVTTDADMDVVPPSTTITVAVTNMGAPKSQVLVVFHDADGAILGTRTTGADGKATWDDGPAPMVTALLGNQQYPHLVTWTAVERGDTLDVVDLYSPRYPGKYVMTIAGGDLPPLGADTAGVSMNDCTSSLGYAPPVYTVQADVSCTRGQNQFFAVATNAQAPVAMAVAKNVPPMIDGGTTNIAHGPWSGFTGTTTVSALGANAPDGGLLQPVLHEVFGSIGLLAEQTQITVTNVATYKNTQGLNEGLHGGWIEIAEANRFRSVFQRVASGPITVDFANALPWIDSGELDARDKQRPVVRWTPLAPLTGSDGGVIEIEFEPPLALDHVPQQWGRWTFYVAPGSTSVRAPAMPPEARAWTPRDPEGGTVFFLEPRISFFDSDIYPTPSAMRRRSAAIFPPWEKYPVPNSVLPQNGTLRATEITASTILYN